MPNKKQAKEDQDMDEYQTIIEGAIEDRPVDVKTALLSLVEAALAEEINGLRKQIAESMFEGAPASEGGDEDEDDDAEEDLADDSDDAGADTDDAVVDVPDDDVSDDDDDEYADDDTSDDDDDYSETYEDDDNEEFEDEDED